MADTDAQTPVLGAAQLGVDITQTVVAAMAAALFELDLAGLEIQLIMNHQDFFGLDLEKPCQRRRRICPTGS